ncbi:MAG TPA: hypothetical protein VF734_09605, partial [Pseudonocardiaceae bacterium]
MIGYPARRGVYRVDGILMLVTSIVVALVACRCNRLRVAVSGLVVRMARRTVSRAVRMARRTVSRAVRMARRTVSRAVRFATGTNYA